MLAHDLPALRVFLAVADAGSLRRAALELQLSASAVSQAIKRLEAQVGLPLLNRSTRSVALTAAGERLRAELRPALQQLDAGWAEVASLGGQVGGSLRLSVPRSAARLLLMPVLARYARLHPGVNLEVVTQDALVDIVAGGFDAGVRFEERLPQDMVAVPLGGPQRFIVVGAPGLVSQALDDPVQLAHLPCIRQRFASGALFEWTFRHADGRERCPALGGRLVVDEQGVALAAALEGLGLAYVYDSLAADALREGRLVQHLADWCPPGTGYSLYYPGRRQASPALRALVEMLRS